jgi:diguanylate cyclase (GGDEF)-like protein
VPVWIGVSIGFAGLTALLIRKAMGAAAKFDQSEHQARHDLLTGLPNRFGLFQAIETLAPSSGPLRGFAVAYMDLDGFKPINDAFGHAAGDVVLRTVAGRLRQSIPREGLVARIGGDEFVALLIDVTTMREASTICETILDRVGQPIEIDGSFVSVGITVGVAFCPGNGSDALALMRTADEALYAGKRLAKGSVQFHAGLTLATAAG